jgi:hypothetical protein
VTLAPITHNQLDLYQFMITDGPLKFFYNAEGSAFPGDGDDGLEMMANGPELLFLLV